MTAALTKMTMISLSFCRRGKDQRWGNYTQRSQGVQHIASCLTYTSTTLALALFHCTLASILSHPSALSLHCWPFLAMPAPSIPAFPCDTLPLLFLSWHLLYYCCLRSPGPPLEDRLPTGSSSLKTTGSVFSGPWVLDPVMPHKVCLTHAWPWLHMAEQSGPAVDSCMTWTTGRFWFKPMMGHWLQLHL